MSSPLSSTPLPPPLRPAPPEHASDKVLRYIVIAVAVVIGAILMIADMLKDGDDPTFIVVGGIFLIVLTAVLVGRNRRRR